MYCNKTFDEAKISSGLAFFLWKHKGPLRGVINLGLLQKKRPWEYRTDHGSSKQTNGVCWNTDLETLLHWFWVKQPLPVETQFTNSTQMELEYTCAQPHTAAPRAQASKLREGLILFPAQG